MLALRCLGGIDSLAVGQSYLELADGTGWVFDTVPGSGIKIMVGARLRDVFFVSLIKTNNMDLKEQHVYAC